MIKVSRRSLLLAAGAGIIPPGTACSRHGFTGATMPPDRSILRVTCRTHGFDGHIPSSISRSTPPWHLSPIAVARTVRHRFSLIPRQPASFTIFANRCC